MTDVAEPEPTRRDEADAKPGEGFSFFVTRILEQLSLSSWLPAIMLVCNLALILQLRSQHNFDIGRAVTSLTAKPLGILIVLLLSIMLASIVTQAFEFEAIRLLEGYWGSISVLDRLSGLRTKRHIRRHTRLEEKFKKYYHQAFYRAREEMLDKNVDRDIVDILEKQRRRGSLDGHDPTRVAAAERLGWRRFAPPEVLHRMDAIESLIMEYPKLHRILPTRLGNILRSREDQLPRKADEPVEDFVYRRYHLMAPELKVQHNRVRAQLNIYCLLTFIFTSLAIVSFIALVHSWADLAGGIAFAVIYATLALVSYQAAIASVRNYISVLRVIGSLSNEGSPGEGSPG